MCNIQTICRLCGASEGIKFKIFGPGSKYASTINQLLPIMVDERDPWSKLICHRCAFKLQDFYDFRESCVKTDAYFKTQVSWEQHVTSQHIHAEQSQQNGQVKHEQTEQEGTDRPLSTPPQLSPQVKQESKDGSLSEPPTLSPAVVPPPHAQEQTNSLQRAFAIAQPPPPPAPDLYANIVFVNSDLVNNYLMEEPVLTDSDSAADDNDTGCPGSGVTERMGVNTKTETPRTNTSHSDQVSKKRQMSSELVSRFGRTDKVNSVESVLANVKSEEYTKNGRKSDKHEPKYNVRTKTANINDNVLNIRSHAKADTLEKKVMYRPGPKSKVHSRDDNSDSDKSDVEFLLYKPANSVLDVIDMTNVNDSPEEEMDVSDPEEGILPHALWTRIPGMCNIYTCSRCEGTFTSKRRVNSHVCKRKEFNSASPDKQVPEDKTSGEKTCKDMVPAVMASENRASEEEASDKMTLDNKDESSRGSTTESTFSSSGSLVEVPRIQNLKLGAATVGKDLSRQDMVSAGRGSYKCDLCGFTFSRLVTLMSHKNRHLYRTNDNDDDDDGGGGGGGDDDYYDDDYICVRKKKKRVAKTVTEEC